MLFRSPKCSVFLNERSFICEVLGKRAFRKSSRSGLLASSPKIFLNPKSVKGLIYLAFMALLSFISQIYKKIRKLNVYKWLHLFLQQHITLIFLQQLKFLPPLIRIIHKPYGQFLLLIRWYRILNLLF